MDPEKNTETGMAAPASRRRAASTNVLFGASNIAVSLVAGLVMVPVYLRFFDLSTYGAWLASGGILGMVGMLDFGFDLVLTQRLAEAAGAGDANRFRRITGSGFAIVSASCAVVIATGLLLADYVPKAMQAPGEQHQALAMGFRMAAVGAGFSVLHLGLKALLQAWHLTVASGVSQVASAAVAVVTTVAGLCLGMGVAALGFGQLVRGVTATAIAAWAGVAGWKSRDLAMPWCSTSELGSLARATLPVFISRATSLVVGNSEAAIVSATANPESAAVLSITGRLLSVAAMGASIVGPAVYSGMAHLAAEAPERLPVVTGDVLALGAALSGVLLGGSLALSQGFVELWVGPGKFGGLLLCMVIGGSILITSRLSLVASAANSLGQLGATAWVSIVAMVVRLVLLVLLLQVFGLVGIPLSVILGETLVTVAPLALILSHGLRVPWAQAGRLMLAGFTGMVGSLIFGGLWAAMVPASRTWIGLVAQGCAVGVGLLGITLATNAVARGHAMGLWGRCKRGLEC